MPQKRKELNITGANLWYLVGLITSDGCLSSDGRHIDITAKDYHFLKGLKDALGLRNKVTVKYGSNGNRAFRVQIGNKNFYEFCLSVGLTPKKSLTLDKISVPKGYFLDFLRGIIDGDGGIQCWTHATNFHEQWNLRISSGSRNFLEWLKNMIEEIVRVRGGLYSQSETQFRLKYGKMAAREIIKHCYYAGCLGLGRKIKLARECLSSYQGWSKSITVLCDLA